MPPEGERGLRGRSAAGHRLGEVRQPPEEQVPRRRGQPATRRGALLEADEQGGGRQAWKSEGNGRLGGAGLQASGCEWSEVGASGGPGREGPAPTLWGTAANARQWCKGRRREGSEAAAVLTYPQVWPEQGGWGAAVYSGAVAKGASWLCW